MAKKKKIKPLINKKKRKCTSVWKSLIKGLIGEDVKVDKLIYKTMLA